MYTFPADLTPSMVQSIGPLGRPIPQAGSASHAVHVPTTGLAKCEDANMISLQFILHSG